MDDPDPASDVVLLPPVAAALLAAGRWAPVVEGAWRHAEHVTVLEARAALLGLRRAVRNAGLRHRSTLQSATGIRAERLVQKSMGMAAGAFNTREFFHGASQLALKNIRLAFVGLCFVLPALLLVWALASQTTLPLLLAALVQAPGLIAERWFFFAQARHPQNLYYQVVS